jgi:hypothetical protein
VRNWRTEVGDRFYEAQKNYKPKRRLKADILKELDEVLGSHVEGLDRLTIKSLDSLIETLNWRFENE